MSSPAFKPVYSPMSSSGSSSRPPAGPPRVQIVAIGDELLRGSTVDTNSAFLGQKLTSWGYRTLGSRTCPDSVDDICRTLDHAASEADLILVTGGLGPTDDDRTRDALAQWSGRELVHDDATLERIRDLFSRMGRDMPESNRRQALVPAGGRVIENPSGTAPAIILERKGIRIIAMPGVPREVRGLIAGELGRDLSSHPELAPPVSRVLRTTGISESRLAERIPAIRDEVTLAFLPNLGGVNLVFSANEKNSLVLDEVVEGVSDSLGFLVFGRESDTLEGVIGGLLSRHDWTVAVAESCTAGTISARIGSVPGASRYFVEGVVAYANDAKVERLSVDPKLLEHHGAVSEETACAMAEGIRRDGATDFGLATTGVAGPSGGTSEKPVGTVWIACAGPGGPEARLLRLAGDRAAVVERTTAAALDHLRRRILRREMER